MAINNFADVQNFFSTIDASQAPHGNFWKQSDDPTASYLAFVNGNVPGGSQTANPDTNQPLPILIKGDGEHSNITHQSTSKTTFLLYFPKAGATLGA